LPKGVITALVTDHDGFLWIGTQSGLVKYDGNKFNHVPKNKNSLIGNYVKTLYVSKSGELWIGTMKNGLSVYDPQKNIFTNFQHDPKDRDSIASNRIEAIVEDELGGIWIGTNNGLDLLPLNKDKFVHFKYRENDKFGINDNHIRSLAIDQSGALWIGSWNGLNKLTPHNNSIERIHTQPDDENSFHKQNITSLAIDQKGVLWVGTRKNGYAKIVGENQVKRFSFSRTQYKGNDEPWVFSIVQTSNEEVWIGTYGQGIYAVNLGTGEISEQHKNKENSSGSISMDNIGAIYVDKSNLIWVGTWGAGLNYYHPNNSTFSTLGEHKEIANEVTSLSILSVIESSNDQIWQGTHENGINIIELSDHPLSKINANNSEVALLKNDSIKVMHQPDNNTVLIGTMANGLYKYTIKENELTAVGIDDGIDATQIFTISSDIEGGIWIGTSRGLYYSNGNKKSFIRLSTLEEPDVTFSDAIKSIVHQANGTTWISSLSKLYYIPPDGHWLVEVSHENNGISSTEVLGFLVTKSDSLWVGTNSGLNRLINSKLNEFPTFELIDTKLKQPQGTPLKFGNMLEDSLGRIWNPSAMLDPNDWSIYFFDHFDSPNVGGIWQGSSLVMKDGTMMFGGTMGGLLINPDNFRVRRYQPPLVVTEIKIDENNIFPTNAKDIYLLPTSKSISIKFSALDFSSSSKLRYAYKLDGFDERWIETDNVHRVAKYTNLNPGKYYLQIKSADKMGVWQSNFLSLNIHVAPSWFQTWWARAVFFILIILVLVILYKIRIRRFKERQNQLKLQVEERTFDLKTKSEEVTRSYNLLMETKNQLVETEKQAVLGRLVAGGAHELNTPIGSGITAVSLISSDIETIKTLSAEGKMTQRVFNDRIERLYQCSTIVSNSYERAAILIDSFKMVSVASEPENHQTFRLDKYLGQVQEAITPLVVKAGHKITFNIHLDVMIHSVQKSYHYIIEQLVNNAIIHGFSSPQIQGEITVCLQKQNDSVVLCVRDNGKGIDSDNQKQIFDPFFTTNRKNGSVGLGLHIIHNIVTQQLGGEIYVIDSNHQGIEFLMKIPINDS
jgi:ligand-binding sensor domain-containing protein/signal transduction histidine kinase